MSIEARIAARNERLAARMALLESGWKPEPEPHGPRPNTLHERMVVRDQHVERRMQAHCERMLVDAGSPKESVGEIVDLAYAAGESAVARVHEVIGTLDLPGNATFTARDLALMIAEVRLSQLVSYIRKQRGQIA